MAKSTAEPVPATMRIADPELQAMAKVDLILAGLDENTKGRVLAWLMTRYTGGKWLTVLGGMPVETETPKE